MNCENHLHAGPVETMLPGSSKLSILVTFVGLMCLHHTSALTKPSSVKLENNEYTGVVIAIHPDEPESDELINSIKTMIHDASSYLYRATKKRAYFKDVMILVPDTWEDKPEYQSPRNATFEGADVIIAPRNHRFAPEPDLSPDPYTKHYEGCGGEALHVHLTSHFMLNEMTVRFYGNRGRVFVHEWAHYRWGIFNEYADEIADIDNAQHFYYSIDEQIWKPTRCSEGFASSNLVFENDRYRECNGNQYVGYEDNCVSIPSPTQPDVSASIMSGYTSIEEIVDFCDDDVRPAERHDRDAPHKHQRLCGSKSNWVVMREHPDFNNGNNLPRHVLDVTPNITIARMGAIRVVLVLDTSGSMDTANRISKLVSSARNFVTSIAVDGSFVGIVEFKSKGERLSGLTLIDSDETRRQLADLIPTTAEGGTCIGCGLETALEILSEGGASPAGGLVLLITDGQDNNPDLTTPWKFRYVEEHVVIDAVAFSHTAEKNVTYLQEATGGKLFLQTDDPGSTGLYDAFQATMVSGVKEYDRRIELYSGSAVYQVGESRSHGVYVDRTVGNKTSFDFTYIVESSTTALDVSITSPSGTMYNKTYDGYGVDLTFKVVSVTFQFAEPGLWSYEVFNTHSSRHEIFTSISTYASQEGVDPIIATSELSGSITDFANGQPLVAFAEVRQGLSPVIRANVIATIERPPDNLGVTYPPVHLQLFDNGAGADVTRDDGIYSRFFTKFTGVGYYGIKININNDHGTAIILNDGAQLPFSRSLSFVNPEELLQGNIPKIGNTTLLLPGMPVPTPRGEPAPKFTRAISSGSSRVPETPENWQPNDDIIAPSTIFDLRVTSAFYDNETVKLEFTAPGDNLDSGKASYYNIRMSSTASELLANFSSLPTINQTDLLIGDLSSPGDFGDRELFVIKVAIPKNEPVVSYTFAVNAVDESENEGDMSNIVQATLRKYIPPPLTTIQTTTLYSTTEKEFEPTDHPNLLALWIVLGIAAIGLVLTVFVLVLFKKFSKKENSVQDPRSDYHKDDVEQNVAYNNNACTFS